MRQNRFPPGWDEEQVRRVLAHYERQAVEIEDPKAEGVTVTEDSLAVDLSDGRIISVPLAWFPRLLHASPTERKNWRLIGKGQGIHWADIDEDISVEDLLAGKPSGESRTSFRKWLAGRRSRRTSRASRRVRHRG